MFEIKAPDSLPRFPIKDGFIFELSLKHDNPKCYLTFSLSASH